MPKTIAFIPARKGSKRLPKKNALSFHGKPLAWWTIDFARTSYAFDRIVLSTNDEAIAALAGDDVTVCRRPENLATDDATIIEVIRHTADKLGLDEGCVIVVLMVTAPLRVRNDLIEGLRLFEEHGRARTVVSVGANHIPPALLWRLDDEGNLTSLADDRDPAYTRKQNHPPTYHSNDILVIDTVGGFLLPGRDLFGPNPVGLLTPPERNMPIDDPIHFRLAEYLFPPENARSRPGTEPGPAATRRRKRRSNK